MKNSLKQILNPDVVNLNFEHLGKSLGLSKADLAFLLKPNFQLIDSSVIVSGVLVGYRPVSNNYLFYSPWVLKTCSTSQKDLSYLNSLINNQNINGASYEYFISDAFGKILFSNCIISNTIDEQGLIHFLTNDASLNQFVYPATRTDYNYKIHYCHGKSIKELNSQINELSKKKIIKKPSLLKNTFQSTRQAETLSYE